MHDDVRFMAQVGGNERLGVGREEISNSGAHERQLRIWSIWGSLSAEPGDGLQAEQIHGPRQGEFWTQAGGVTVTVL